MIVLNDKQIRSALVNKLVSLTLKPNAILHELRVHNGNAIADVVAIYSEAHCFEIKGDGDKIERIIKQGPYYDLSFRKITLVTTPKHIEKALKIAPIYWGLMVATAKDNEISIKHVRAAKSNKNFDKSVALKMLWKDEMLNLGYSENKHKRKDDLVQIISKDFEKKELNKSIGLQLLHRHQQSN